MFFAPGTKNHGIYSVLWPEPSKNSGIYAVFSMLQDVLLPGQTHKNTVNYSVSAFETRWKPSKTTNKCPKWSISFGPKKPGKRQVGFWALPPQAPALPFKNGPISGLPPPTPPRLASLRFAYTYTQAQAFGWLSWLTTLALPSRGRFLLSRQCRAPWSLFLACAGEGSMVEQVIYRTGVTSKCHTVSCHLEVL